MRNVVVGEVVWVWKMYGVVLATMLGEVRHITTEHEYIYRYTCIH